MSHVPVPGTNHACVFIVTFAPAERRTERPHDLRMVHAGCWLLGGWVVLGRKSEQLVAVLQVATSHFFVLHSDGWNL